MVSWVVGTWAIAKKAGLSRDRMVAAAVGFNIGMFSVLFGYWCFVRRIYKRGHIRRKQKLDARIIRDELPEE